MECYLLDIWSSPYLVQVLFIFFFPHIGEKKLPISSLIHVLGYVQTPKGRVCSTSFLSPFCAWTAVPNPRRVRMDILEAKTNLYTRRQNVHDDDEHDENPKLLVWPGDLSATSFRSSLPGDRHQLLHFTHTHTHTHKLYFQLHLLERVRINEKRKVLHIIFVRLKIDLVGDAIDLVGRRYRALA